METFFADVRYGARLLLTRPGITAIALLTLAIGIGANTAIFSVVNGVLLRPLPFPEPEQLVMLWQDQTRLEGPPPSGSRPTTSSIGAIRTTSSRACSRSVAGRQPSPASTSRSS